MPKDTLVVELRTRRSGVGEIQRQKGRCWPRVCECDVNEGAKDRFFGATEVDEGRSLDVGRQRQASNQAVRLGSKRPWS